MLIDGKDYEVDYRKIPLFITPTQIHNYLRREFPTNWFGKLPVGDGVNSVTLHGYAYPTKLRENYSFVASSVNAAGNRLYGSYTVNHRNGRVNAIQGFVDTWEAANSACVDQVSFYWLTTTVGLYDMRAADWYGTNVEGKQAFIVRSSSTRQYWAGCWAGDKCEVFATVGPFGDYQLPVAALVEFGVTDFWSMIIRGDPVQMPNAQPQAQEVIVETPKRIIVPAWRPF